MISTNPQIQFVTPNTPLPLPYQGQRPFTEAVQVVQAVLLEINFLAGLHAVS